MKLKCYTVSQWETFSTCPRQYQAKYITKEVEFKPTPESLYGDEVHDALEVAIKQNSDLPPRFAHYQSFLDWVRARPGTIVAEGKVAVDAQWNPTGFFSPDARWRGKVDVVARDEVSAESLIFDWKTGKRRDKPDQLHMYATFELSTYPSVGAVRAGFVWLKDQVVSPPTVYSRDNLRSMQAEWDYRAETLDYAAEVDKFPPRPSGLCNGWCDVTDCKFWKPKRR